MDCVFCKILDGSIPSKRVWEDEKFILINDVAPQAKVHYLAIPKFHKALLSECTKDQLDVIKHIICVVTDHQSEWGLCGGYRIMINQGSDGNQTVPHLHIHFLGGEKLKG